jgi:2-haloacid dehalogenase
MPEALGFDIYGTLVDPLEMTSTSGEVVGEGAERFSALWREKQIEYTWRRGLMREYADFGVCTRQALDFAALSFGLELSSDQRERLLEEYQNLRPFPDVLPGLERLRSEGTPWSPSPTAWSGRRACCWSGAACSTTWRT